LAVVVVRRARNALYVGTTACWTLPVSRKVGHICRLQNSSATGCSLLNDGHGRHRTSPWAVLLFTTSTVRAHRVPCQVSIADSAATRLCFLSLAKHVYLERMSAEHRLRAGHAVNCLVTHDDGNGTAHAIRSTVLEFFLDESLHVVHARVTSKIRQIVQESVGAGTFPRDCVGESSVLPLPGSHRRTQLSRDG
jgi:hypothetical protein